MPFIGTVQKRQRHRDRRRSPGCLGVGGWDGNGGQLGGAGSLLCSESSGITRMFAQLRDQTKNHFAVNCGWMVCCVNYIRIKNKILRESNGSNS